MNLIYLNPDPATGSINIDIDQVYNVVKIVRINANGSAEVRVAEGQLPAGGDRLILDDYEAAEGVNTYNAYLADGTFDSATAFMELKQPWFMVPVAPHYSETIEVATNFSATQTTSSTMHKILGRSDPLVVLGELSTRTGVLEVFAGSLEKANSLARVFSRGEAVFFKQTVPGMDMYLIADSITIDPYSVEDERTLYRFTIQYTEVKRPYGFLAGGLGWTFDSLATEYTSFEDVLNNFVTFDNLTLGDAQSAVSDFD